MSVASGRDVWGANEHSQTIDTLLNTASSTLFARVGTSILYACGYQVLDSAGTGALKKACDSKPQAANIALSEAGVGARTWFGPRVLSTAPNKPPCPPTDKIMGFSLFDGNTESGGKSLTAFLPFTRGVLPSEQDLPFRTNIAQSPLWKLPTRLVFHVLNGDDVEGRMEWLSDPGTTARFRTAPNVMQDRYINVKAKLSTDNLSDKATQLVVSALRWRLNSPTEGCGSLEWAAHRFADGPLTDTVAPYAPGLLYKIFTSALPVFGAGPTDWNAWGKELASRGGDSGEAPPRASYLTVVPKFAPTQGKDFLMQLPRGLGSIQPTKPSLPGLALLYSILVPRELLIARTIQMTPGAWFTLAGDLRAVQPHARTDGGVLSMGLRSDRDPLTLRVAMARRSPAAASASGGGGQGGGEAWSACVGFQQSVAVTGLERFDQQGLPGVGVTLPWARAFGSVSVAFPGGKAQAALEAPVWASGRGDGFKVGCVVEACPPGFSGARLVLGARWEARQGPFFGAGFDVEI